MKDESLRKDETMEKLSMELDRFVYSASHDLRSPISTMKGLVSLLKIGTETSQDEVLDMMNNSLERMETLVNQLSDFAKNRHEYVSSELIDLTGLVQSIWKALSGHPNHHLFDFILTVKTKFLFYSDPKRVELFLRNVIVNALDFFDPEKNDPPFLRVTIKGSPNSWRFEIYDNGPGIASAHVGHVFEMFYRASVNSGGVGLGLYLAKEAILKIKGSIKVKSEYGKWTCVTIVVPNGIKGKLIHKKRELLTRRKIY